MRFGRLAIESDGTPNGVSVLAVPDDGGEPVFVRVNQAFLRARAGEAATLTVRAYVSGIDIVDLEGRAVRARTERPPHVVIYPHVEVREGQESPCDVRALSWRFRAGDLPGPIRLERIEI